MNPARRLVGGLEPLPALDVEAERALYPDILAGRAAHKRLESGRVKDLTERRRLQRERQKGSRAETLLLRSTCGLVRDRVRRFGGRAEDLEGAGIEGLVEALKRFDPKKGVRFSTYAYYWINKMIFDALRSELGISDALMRQVIAAAKIKVPDGGVLTASLVASTLKCTPAAAREVVGYVTDLRRHRDAFDSDVVAGPVEIEDAPAWVIDALKRACGRDFDAFWQATFATTPLGELAVAAGISRQAMSKRLERARQAVRTCPDAPRLRAWWASR